MPNPVRKKRTLEYRQWVTEALASDTEECLPWPYALFDSGYGQVWWYGVKTTIHRLICRLAHGEPSTPDQVAAHSCKMKRCGNRNHLSWKTPKGNAEDRIRDGTLAAGERNGRAKLTQLEADEILNSPEPKKILMLRYNVSRSTIERIKRENTYDQRARADAANSEAVPH